MFHNCLSIRANKTLKSSQSTIFKPDWVLYVVPWYIKREIGACEVKAPNKTNPGPISDFAKLALQMKSMVNELVHLGVDDPRAYGFLVEGNVHSKSSIARYG
jgi:hypothetical protein